MRKALHHNNGEITLWWDESRNNVRMIYGQKPKYQVYWFYINQELLFMQESSLTLYIDQMLVKSRENLQRLEPCRELENILIYTENIKNKSGNLEYLIQYS